MKTEWWYKILGLLHRILPPQSWTNWTHFKFLKSFPSQGSKWRDPLSLAILELQEKGTIQVDNINQASWITFLPRQRNSIHPYILILLAWPPSAFLILLSTCDCSDALQQVVEEHGGRVHKARQEQRLKGGLLHSLHRKLNLVSKQIENHHFCKNFDPHSAKLFISVLGFDEGF